ncbi:MAG: pitrilysin family protein [Candidatus Sericytochromatia bacterium]|nr:pitrilysin family protein [Candidatus Sericytochromatia bacterium]
MRFRHLEHPRMGLHVLATDKFKTNTVVVNLRLPLEQGRVTRVALLPYVMTRGTVAHPSVRAMNAALDRLYGSFLTADVHKLGDRQVVQFRLELPNGKYLPGQPELLREGLAFLYEVLTRPVREQGAFKAAFVDLEKDALRKRIAGIFNNKGAYARIRCVEAMFPGDPYGMFSGGRIEDLPAIDPAALEAEYARLLAESPMDVFVVGDVEPEAVADELRRVFTFEGLRTGSPVEAPMPQGVALPPGPVEVRRITEAQDVNQGQLVLGLRTPVRLVDPGYYAMAMYNGVLGAFAHSKLFMTLREKESLAYATSSRYDPHRGVLFIQAGIDVAHEARAVTVIEAALAALRRGEVSEQELAQTRAMMLHGHRETEDSPGRLIMTAFEALVAGREHPHETLAERLPGIGVAEVAAAAETLRLDTIYFLRDAQPAPTATP